MQTADFWNLNPCGGQWRSYEQYLDWLKKAEPYIFPILDSHDWKNKRVADIGCGQGPALNYLASRGATVFGLDVSLDSIQRARVGASELGHLHRTLLMRGDAERLPFTDASFDAVVSLGVLHHTEDTSGGILELHRILKKDGLAIVMLYRSGNPKWWVVKTIRTVSKLIDRVSGKPHYIAAFIRRRQTSEDPAGTALLELFGVPILKSFSNDEVRKMFSPFRDTTIVNHEPGFRRISDVVPAARPLRPMLRWMDSVSQKTWGFYQVIEARK